MITFIFLSSFAGAAVAERAVTDAAAIPHVNERGRQGYRDFLKSEMHRAFAIGPGGLWGWKAGLDTPGEAVAAAKDACGADAEQVCIPYAVNDKVVFDEKIWSTLWRPYATAEEASYAPPGTNRGDSFPDLVLTDPRGKPFPISSLRGKVVLLHFWGTWCPSCVHELPQFEKLRVALADVPDILFVFSQVREPPAEARRWLERQGLRLPLYDSGSHGPMDTQLTLTGGRTLSDRSLAPAFPTTYVLDRYGLVVFSHRGSAQDWSQYAAFLRDLAVQTAQ